MQRFRVVEPPSISQSSRLPSGVQSPDNSGSDGGDGMLERLIRLEVKADATEQRLGAMEQHLGRMDGHIGALDTRLRSVETGIATLTERVAHLPSKGFIVTSVMIALSLVAAVTAFIQWVLQATAG